MGPSRNLPKENLADDGLKYQAVSMMGFFKPTWKSSENHGKMMGK
jgi:hypothetical protein